MKLGSWVYRRTYLFACTLFCMGVVGWCLKYNVDTRIGLLAVEASFWVIFASVACYVFGATISDIGFLRSGYAASHLTATKDKVEVDSVDSGGVISDTSGVSKGPEGPTAKLVRRATKRNAK